MDDCKTQLENLLTAKTKENRLLKQANEDLKRSKERLERDLAELRGSDASPVKSTADVLREIADSVEGAEGEQSCGASIFTNWRVDATRERTKG